MVTSHSNLAYDISLRIRNPKSYARIITCVFLICYLLSFTACIRTCQNKGVLDEGTCMCSCVGGFSGVNCESECIVRRGKSHGCRMTQNDDPLIFSHFITILACLLTCYNGGTRNETTCTCACADGYSGDTCGSECIMCHIDSCSLLLVGYELALKHISMRISLILHLVQKL